MAAVQQWPLLSLLLTLALASPALAGSHWEPTGELILRFEGDLHPSPARLDRLARSEGIAALSPLEGSWPLYRLQLLPGRDLQSIASALQRQPDVRWVEPDRHIELVPHGLPLNDTYWDQLWHLQNDGSIAGAMAGVDVHALPAWNLATGLGILVAVVDGGVDPNQPDLLQDVGIDVLDDDSDASPDLDTDSPAHGTAVAGLIAAIGNNGIGVAGVAWQATIIPVRLIGNSTLSDLYDAFSLSTDRGASVINNSWGYKTEDCADAQGSSIIDDAIDYADLNGRGGLGTSVTFSMGNEGCHDQVQPILGHPATLGVGAINKAGLIHGYSNTGANTDLVAPSGGLRTTDIVGPEGMNGLGEDYTNSMGGTSGSCPLVSGVIALMYEANPRLTADEVQQVLCVTADRVNLEGGEYNAAGWSNTYGCGRVDAASAVAAVFNRAPSAPVLLGPEDGSTVASDEVLIQWEAAEDPDQDPLRYIIEVHPEDLDGDDDDSAAAGTPPSPSLEIDGIRDTWRLLDDDDLPPGTWEVQVWATDAWGRGAGSEVLAFEVTAAQAPPEIGDELEDGEGCTCQGGSAAPAALFLVFAPPLGLRRRRHRA
jgi:subtilisin family serine protease